MGLNSGRYKEVAIDLVLSKGGDDEQRGLRNYAVSIRAPGEDPSSSETTEAMGSWPETMAARSREWTEVDQDALTLDWERFKECRRQLRRGEKPEQTTWTE